jgi:hypothetical protein
MRNVAGDDAAADEHHALRSLALAQHPGDASVRRRDEKSRLQGTASPPGRFA